MTQVHGLSWVIKYRFDALVVFREMTFLLRQKESVMKTVGLYQSILHFY